MKNNSGSVEHHPLRPTFSAKKPSRTPRGKAASAPRWPSYTGSSQLVGASPSARVTVYVDASLGQAAMQNAQDLINDADRIVAANDAIFGTTGGAVSVILFALNGATDGTGGADHDGCDYVSGAAIEVCVAFGNSARCSALFEAELSECSMNNNLCGLSTGEALSRWCAAAVGSNALADFATAPTWAQDGMPNFVDKTDPSDQNADSIGCGMAFLSWLMSQGYMLNRIAPAMVTLGNSGTLAQLYESLTSNWASNAWPSFQSAVKGLANGVTSDDPFGGVAQPAQVGNVDPRAVEMAGKIFSSILSDMGAGKAADQIVAGVRGIIAGTSAGAVAAAAAGPAGWEPGSTPKKGRRK